MARIMTRIAAMVGAMGWLWLLPWDGYGCCYGCYYGCCHGMAMVAAMIITMVGVMVLKIDAG